MLIFSRQNFLDKVFWVSYTCCSDYSVYDGRCTYTHLLHAHFSGAHTLCAYFTLLMRVTYTHGSGVRKKVFAHVCHSSPSRLLLSHASPIFLLSLHGHFETTPDYDLTDTDIHKFLPYFPILKAQDMRHSALASRSLATWPYQMQTQVVSPESSTRSPPWMMTRCSSTIRTTISLTSRKTHTKTKDSSVFSQCLNPLFRTFLIMILLFR